MIRNYLTVAIRNLTTQAGYMFINVAGLAIGIACCILVLLYVQSELSYDRFHKKADQVYKVIRETLRDGETSSNFHSFKTSGALAPALKTDFPEIQQAVRRRNLDVEVQYGNKAFSLFLSIVDQDFLDVFTFPMIKGNSEIALQEPFSVVITKKTAQRLFGDRDPIGKVIVVKDRDFGGEYTVKGVLRDIPENSTLHFELLTS